jgi:hypothetical protein
MPASGTGGGDKMALQAGPLRYQSSIGMGGVGGLGAVSSAAHIPATGGGGLSAIQGTQQAGVGIPMGIAALGPLVALVGKALKDRTEN